MSKEINYKEINDWVLEAGDQVREYLNFELLIETKANKDDLVTNMDRQTETLLRSRIFDAYPDHRIIGEEGIEMNATTLEGYVWIIDPIDGTMNFVRQKDNFCVMVALYRDGEGIYGAIYDVMNEDLYYAINGQGAFVNDQRLIAQAPESLSRSLVALNGHTLINNLFSSQEIVRRSSGGRSYGSAGIETIFTISGKLGAYISPHLSPWDIAAGAVLAKEMGLLYTKIDGSAIDLTSVNPILLAWPNVHQEVLEIIASNV